MEAKDGSLEAHEKTIRKLEIELKDSESENKKLREKIRELEEDHASKYRKLSGIRESFDGLNLESEKSKKKIRELEEELESHGTELGELVNSSQKQIEDSNRRVSELESLVESRKLEIEDMQVKLGRIDTYNEALAEANMKLTEDLALSESDLHRKLSNASVEKNEISSQYRLSNKRVEDLTLELSSVKENFQSEISKVLEESGQLREAKKKLEALISQLEEQLKEYKHSENILKTETEYLKSELSDKYTLEARLKEVEEQYQTTESMLKEKVESLQTIATAREGDLTAQLKHDEQKLSDNDERVLQLEKELRIALTDFNKLKEESSAIMSKMETEKSLAEELQKLQNLEALSKHKANESNAGTPPEVRSKDIGSEFSSPVERKSKKFEKSSSQPTSSAVTMTTQGAAASMNVKIIIAVALASIIVGMILGKRY